MAKQFAMDANTPIPNIRKLNALQALRGVAALLVLFFHTAEIQRSVAGSAGPAELDIINGFWDRGYMGVDLFFVISGFIMVYVTQNTGRTFKDVIGFIFARIVRIYPLWWFFAGLMVAYFLFAYQTPAPPDRITGVAQIVPYLFKSFFLIPQYQLPVLGVGWTLIHEMYFYVIFAGILLLSRRYLLFALLGWALCVGIVFNAGLATPMVSSYPSLTASLLNLEFIGGALAAWLIGKGKTNYAGICAIIGALSLFIACNVYTTSGAPMLLWGRVAVFALPCTLLVYGLAGLELSEKFNMPHWIVRIGDWSYSLYLSHIFVLSTLKIIFVKLGALLPQSLASLFIIGTPGVADNLFFALIACIASIIFAGTAYRFFEQPLLRLSRRMIKRRT